MDVLITDIAPVDLVMQRAGRIHRHDRARPAGFEQPLVLVAGPLAMAWYWPRGEQQR